MKDENRDLLLGDGSPERKTLLPPSLWGTTILQSNANQVNTEIFGFVKYVTCHSGAISELGQTGVTYHTPLSQTQ